jgi:hypothetical protein
MSSQRLRCVFVTMAPLLSEIVTAALAKRVDLQVLAQFPEREQLTPRLQALSPDLAVIGLKPGEPDEIGFSLLAHLPRAKLVLISDDGNCAYVHELVPRRKVLRDFSPDALLAALLH